MFSKKHCLINQPVIDHFKTLGYLIGVNLKIECFELWMQPAKGILTLVTVLIT